MAEIQKVCIGIPIYKVNPSPDEILSIKQCLIILGSYPIYFITHKDLETNTYENLLSQYNIPFNVKFFHKNFFLNINGYNKLMKSYNFYNSFSEYEYILIYQPDAWVFSDKLLEWCNKNYDYIGAPWVDGLTSPEKGNKFLRSGNGGFSLRKINWFKTTLSSSTPIFTKTGLKKQISITKSKITFKNFIKFFLKIIGYKTGILNYIKYIITSKRTEDWFWVETFANCETFFPMKIPEPEEAMFFAFEQWSSYLFKQTNNMLPFGVHAWKKYEYETFWKDYIPVIRVKTEKNNEF